MAENRCLFDSLTYAAKWMQTLSGDAGVRSTYQGMTNVLTKWTPALLPIEQTHFHGSFGKANWLS